MVRETLGFARGAEVVAEGDELTLLINSASVGLGPATAGLRDAFDRLSRGDCTADELELTIMGSDSIAGLSRWTRLLALFERSALIRRVLVGGDGTVVAALTPTGPGPSADASFDGNTPVRLSRTVVITMDTGALLLRVPTHHLAIELGPVALPLLAQLRTWTRVEQLPLAPARPDSDEIQILAMWLVRIGACDLKGKGSASAMEQQALAGWNIFDIYVHSRSRGQALVDGWGGTYHLKERYQPLPAERPHYPDAAVVQLPALADEPGDGHSLGVVMESRQSIREHDDEHPLTIEQLSEFLYRTARTRKIVRTSTDLDEVVDRPYPSGGALHELEVYLVVRTCDGVAPGVWHYRSVDHELEQVAPPSDTTVRLLDSAGSATVIGGTPQILVIVAARFGRTMWKYETIAYPLILKNAGVLLQNFYLVATEMQLCGSAVGSGDARQFAEATGNHPLVEGSVAEFVLGSRRSDVTQTTLNNWR